MVGDICQFFTEPGFGGDAGPLLLKPKTEGGDDGDGTALTNSQTASGRLANAGFCARWPPIIAAEVTISELTDSSMACAKTSCAMLRFKGWPRGRWV